MKSLIILTYFFSLKTIHIYEYFLYYLIQVYKLVHYHINGIFKVIIINIVSMNDSTTLLNL